MIIYPDTCWWGQIFHIPSLLSLTQSRHFIYFYSMKTSLLSFLMLLFFYGHSQDTITCYFDEALSLTTKKQGIYAGTITAQENGWEAVAFYNNGNALMRGLFKDKKLRTKQGYYNLYYPNGNRRAFTYFNNNTADSTFMGWHANGQLSDSGIIRQQVRTGPWKTWYSDGRQESSGTFINGARDGIWYWYHANGKPATIETYRNYKLHDLTCFDTLGIATGSNCRLENKPCPKNAYDFETFIMENLLYPKVALKKGIEGEVAFEFFITKEGKLTNINFTNEANALLQEEVVRLLKSVKEWDPAVSHNRNIDYLYNYTVPFYLPE